MTTRPSMSPALKAAEPRDRELVATADAYLPAPQPMPVQQAQPIADAFFLVRDRYAGRRAAPVSALADSPERIATALSSVTFAAKGLPDDAAWALIRPARLAFIDLQAFVPDELAEALDQFDEINRTGTGRLSPEVRAGAEAATERIMAAQAVATQLIRGDINAIGNRTALRDADIRIGEAEQALAAVAKYRERQAGGILSILMAPVLAVVSGLVTLTVRGHLDVALIAVVVLGIGGAFAGPFIGVAAGTIGSRFDRAALRLTDTRRIQRMRRAIAIAELAVVIGVPLALGIFVAVVIGR